MRSCSSSWSRVPSAAWPRSSADRATDFESVRGGSTPPGAIFRCRRDVRRGAQAVAPRRTSPFIATRPSERTGDVARRILARGQGAGASMADRCEAHKPGGRASSVDGSGAPAARADPFRHGLPRDPLRPGCACCPAQRVRSRIGPWPRGQAFGTTVSSGGSAKAAPSYGTPPPMCFGQDLLP